MEGNKIDDSKCVKFYIECEIVLLFEKKKYYSD